jgi:hypothetical protein
MVESSTPAYTLSTQKEKWGSFDKAGSDLAALGSQFGQ